MSSMARMEAGPAMPATCPVNTKISAAMVPATPIKRT